MDETSTMPLASEAPVFTVAYTHMPSDEPRNLDSLKNIFNSEAKPQVTTALPRALYLRICLLPGGFPAFVHEALSADYMNTYDIVVGAKEMAQLRKNVERAGASVKIDKELYKRFQGFRTEAAKVGMITESKVLSGVIYVHASKKGLL